LRGRRKSSSPRVAAAGEGRRREVAGSVLVVVVVFVVTLSEHIKTEARIWLMRERHRTSRCEDATGDSIEVRAR
jgi:hypothetical protein